MQNTDGCNSSTYTYVNFVAIIHLQSCSFPFFTDFSPTSTILRSLSDKKKGGIVVFLTAAYGKHYSSLLGLLQHFN